MAADRPDERERAAVSAYLAGDDVACERAWERAHRAALDGRDPATAARAAFWLGLCLLLRGQPARAGGWLGRARKLVDELDGNCAAAGYLLIPEALGVMRDDPGTARDLAARAIETATRFDEPDLWAFGVLSAGQSLIAMGEITEGVARLDEVMVSVTAEECGPVTTGIVYCAVILECMALFDLARATEWTDALDAWCTSQPDLRPFRGQCLVHRSQLQQAAGEWRAAITTADAARESLADPPHPALGFATYQQAELHRLVGNVARAEDAYRDASRLGYDPMPGLPLLELACGETAVAAASIRRALQEARVVTDRPALLMAAVEVLRADGDRLGARAAADELSAIAHKSTSDVLDAMAAHAQGAVRVSEGDPAGALGELRRAAAMWARRHMPYEAARTAVVIGLGCAALGDRRAADFEWANAADAFEALGAAPDLDRVQSLRGAPPAPTAVLSGREQDVLGLLAAGRTNQEIAAELVISPHTVRRHVEHIFAKLGVSTRAAATAHAYTHGLLTAAEK